MLGNLQTAGTHDPLAAIMRANVANVASSEDTPPVGAALESLKQAVALCLRAQESLEGKLIHCYAPYPLKQPESGDVSLGPNTCAYEACIRDLETGLTVLYSRQEALYKALAV